MTATLRLLDKADKEILDLPRAIIGAVYEFVHKFRKDPARTQLKPLKGSHLYSARVNADYRALLLHTGDNDYLLVSVRDRKNVYDNLDRLDYRVNQVSGGIEFIDVAAAESVVATTSAAAPLFAAYSRDQLLDLGVAEPLLPLIKKITTEEELYGLLEYAPLLTAEVLNAFYFDGRTPEEVLEQITRPVIPDENVDPTDFAKAATRPSTQVTSTDQAVETVLGEGFHRWLVFLHPTQRKLVDGVKSGSVRVSGGPGTGKTIVALHRVKYLADKPGPRPSILLTTFNKNLAADLRARLGQLDPELPRQVDVINIDKLARSVVAEAGKAADRRIVSDEVALDLLHGMLLEVPSGFDADFLFTEWTQVILGQAVNSRAQYFKVRRVGRGRAISRSDRAEIWELIERFTKRLESDGLWTHRQVAELAARVEGERAARVAAYTADKERYADPDLRADSAIWLKYRYQHIVVDEAQDLGAAHWKMLRAMVAPGPDDLFLVGDTHQRIYENVVSLTSLGINIRGRRSSRLTLSYRTTREILGSALELLSGSSYDDMDDGVDTLQGYRSVLRGPAPTISGHPTPADERAAVVQQVWEWSQPVGGEQPVMSGIAICVPTRDMVTAMGVALAKAGIQAIEIGPDGPKPGDAVHIGTMHRFKGLEYQRMIIAGVTDGLLPRASLTRFETADPVRYRRERQRDRSLLFVASTRARDSLAISYHGTASPFLPGQGENS